jgi:hypothetical protein
MIRPISLARWFGPSLSQTALVCLFVAAGAGALAQTALTINGVTDKSTYDLQASFAVPSESGYSYRVLLDGARVPTDLSQTINRVDYHELSVWRTNLSTFAFSNRLVRFIIQSDRGNPEKGLIRWTPYPPIPSTAAELAGARMRVITPSDYPLGLPIPVVVWLDDEEERARRVNGFVTAAGFETNRVQIFRGAGSGMLPPAAASGPLDYTATLPGLQTNKLINIESTTTWTSRSGVLGSSEIWPPNSRVYLTASLTIPAGMTLTINAGTIVKLNPLVNITINGQVLINGTVDQPVVFTATNVVWPEKTAGAWGGFVMRGSPASRPVLLASGAIFTGGGGGTGWSFPDPSTSHKSQQPVILMSNAVVHLTNSAIIQTAGQVHNGYNPDLVYDHTLCQKAITCGECVGGTVTVSHSAILEFPNDDGVVDGTIADADYDGMYFTTGTHILTDSLFGFAKDDALDSGSGGAGTMWVSNCWVESAQHEAHAWSGGGRVASSFDTVLMNSGQGLECGWSQDSGTSPICNADRVLSTGNSIGTRFGDNYDWNYYGYLRPINSLFIYNYRDVWGMNWNNWLYGINSRDGTNAMNIQGNYLSQANTNHPNNTLWDPANDGWRLAHWMTTPPDAPVGVGLAVRTNRFSLASLFDGVPVRLSSFTTNAVGVNYTFLDGDGGTLAAGGLTFAPGETLKRIYPAGFDVAAQSTVLVMLTGAEHGELTGLTVVTNQGSVAGPQVSCWVATNTLSSGRLPEGMLVKLSGPSGLPVSVDYTYVGGGVTLASGRLTFAPNETVQWINPAGIDPYAYNPTVLTLSNPVGAPLTGISSVLYGTPPVQVALTVSGSQLDLSAFSGGVPVALNRPASGVVSVGFRCEANGGVLTNGTLTFSGAQTVQTVLFPTVNPALYSLIKVSLSEVVNAQLVAPSNVYYLSLAQAQSPLLVQSNSAWRYLDTGGDAGTAWRVLAYNDSTWSNNYAQLGFGDGDERTPIRQVGTNGQNTITFYFRQAFVVPSPGLFTSLAMWLLRDDGGVVYLNGNEVFRSGNMPAAPSAITYTTLADRTGTAENAVDGVSLSSSGLVTGTNIVAVEIHQHDVGSSDISFDFGLTGLPTPVVPAAPLITGPTNGQTFAGGAAVGVTVSAGSLYTNVALYVDTGWVDGRSAGPYVFNVTGLAAGRHELVALGTDGSGKSLASGPVTIEVVGNPDTDGDGMPDAWELAHGLDPLVNDANLDADGDGMKNIDEYLAGTDPQDKTSYLKIEKVRGVNGGSGVATITFQGLAGKSYTVQSADVLPAGSWNTVSNVAVLSSPQLITVQDRSATNTTHRYYRLQTPAGP